MRYSQFKINNFKGGKEITLDLDKNQSKVFTLVGLNESGKTTILEAINLFQEDYDEKKLTKVEVEKVKKDSRSNVANEKMILDTRLKFGYSENAYAKDEIINAFTRNIGKVGLKIEKSDIWFSDKLKIIYSPEYSPREKVSALQEVIDYIYE